MFGGITDDNATGKLQLGVLMAVAEFERSIIQNRSTAVGPRLGPLVSSSVDREACLGGARRLSGFGMKAAARERSPAAYPCPPRESARSSRRRRRSADSIWSNFALAAHSHFPTSPQTYPLRAARSTRRSAVATYAHGPLPIQARLPPLPQTLHPGLAKSPSPVLLPQACMPEGAEIRKPAAVAGGTEKPPDRSSDSGPWPAGGGRTGALDVP